MLNRLSVSDGSREARSCRAVNCGGKRASVLRSTGNADGRNPPPLGARRFAATPAPAAPPRDTRAQTPSLSEQPREVGDTDGTARADSLPDTAATASPTRRCHSPPRHVAPPSAGAPHKSRLPDILPVLTIVLLVILPPPDTSLLGGLDALFARRSRTRCSSASTACDGLQSTSSRASSSRRSCRRSAKHPALGPDHRPVALRRAAAPRRCGCSAPRGSSASRASSRRRRSPSWCRRSAGAARRSRCRR